MRNSTVRTRCLLAALGLVASSCANNAPLKPPAQVTQCRQANAHGVQVFQSGDIAIAFKHFTRALRSARSVDFRQGIVESLNNIGAVYAAVQNWPKARGHFEQAQAIAAEESDWQGLVSALDNLGELERCTGAHDKALATLEQARKLAEQHGLRPHMASIQNHLGLLHLAKGSLPEAQDAFERALKLHRKQDDLAGQAAVFCNLGALSRKNGQLEAATGYFRKALTLDKALGRVHAIADDLCLLAGMAEAQGRRQSALAYYERAAYVIDEANVLWKQEAIWRDVARVAAQLGHKDKAQAASARADEIKSLLDEDGGSGQGAKPRPRRPMGAEQGG